VRTFCGSPKNGSTRSKTNAYAQRVHDAMTVEESVIEVHELVRRFGRTEAVDRLRIRDHLARRSRIRNGRVSFVQSSRTWGIYSAMK
jgi:hypothetical protein